MLVCVPIGLVLFTLLLIGAKRLFKKSEKFRGIVKKIENKLFYSMPLRTSIISFLSFCVSAKFGAIFSLRNEEEKIGGKEFVFRLLCILIITGSYWFVKYVEPLELQMTAFKTSFGTLYQNLKLKEEMTMFSTTFFFMRRMFFVLALSEEVFPIRHGFVTMV